MMKPVFTANRLLGYALAAWSCGSSLAGAQNLIPDGGFEEGHVLFCNQGYIPPPWFNIQPIDGADVYSYDCSILEGLDPTAFDNFTGLPAAFDGIRFVAGWSDGLGFPDGEPFGVPLVTTLLPGHCYRLKAYFTASNTHSSIGHFRVLLSTDAALGNDVLLGKIGDESLAHVWIEDEVIHGAS
jgi:hypothetical protein